MKEVFLVIGTSAASVAALFFLTKLLGYRQISQMTLFDYIIGITLGSIAAEMATDLETLLQPLTAMVVYTLTAWLIAVGTNKSMKARRFLVGKSLILFDKGILYNENLRLAKIDIQEFLIQCRNSGYFDLNNIQTAVLEPNGKVSILPKADSRPVTPQDMKLTPSQETLTANVVVDGQILADNLRQCGKDEEWLQKQLSAKGISSAKDVFLATCDSQGKCTVYVRMADRCRIDIFE